VSRAFDGGVVRRLHPFRPSCDERKVMNKRSFGKVLTSAVLGAGTLLASLFSTTPAEGRACTSSADRGCFRDHSGSNHSSVAVGAGIACAILSPSVNIYQNGLLCYVPSGAVYVASKLPPANMSAVFGNTATTRIRALAIQGPGNLMPGPFTLWVLREDGTLFLSRGDSRFRDSRDEMRDFVQVSGMSNIKTLHVIQPTWSQSSFVIGSNAAGEVFTYSNGWVSIIPAGQYYKPIGGPLGGLGIKGSVPSGRALELFYWNITPNDVPQIPTSVKLLGNEVGGVCSGVCPREWYLRGQTTPLALGLEDVWMLTDATDMNKRIYRATRGASTWTGWGPYATGTFPDFDVPPLLPWSIVDARIFRNRRGELLLIGDNYHLVSYIP
jgi:hypothetical protein